MGGASSRPPESADEELSDPAKALVGRAFEGIEAGELHDYHAHIVGLGAGGTGARVNPNMQSLLSPGAWLRYRIYMSAAAVEDEEVADRQYVERLVALARSMPVPPRIHACAFDRNHRSDGSADDAHSEFYTPNDYVFRLAEEFPDVIVPVMSVHPYRKDALRAVRRWAERGGRMVKWLPNSMGIDPAAPRNDPFYRELARLGLVLYSHGGEEKAVEAEEAQELGNPLRLRRALDLGVKVVVAHAASLGRGEDLDAPEPAEGQERPWVDNFDLFMRLMEDPGYVDLVFGDVSATTQSNRVGTPLLTLLRRTDLHPRLVNGSDYPLPAINALIRTGPLVDAGLVTEDEADALAEIYDFNPLLFDFVVKRTVRHPKTGGRFPASLFRRNPALD